MNISLRSIRPARTLGVCVALAAVGTACGSPGASETATTPLVETSEVVELVAEDIAATTAPVVESNASAESSEAAPAEPTPAPEAPAQEPEAQTPAPEAPTPPAPVETTPPAPVETTPPAPVETTPPAPVETTPPAPVETTPPLPIEVVTVDRGTITASKNCFIGNPELTYQPTGSNTITAGSNRGTEQPTTDEMVSPITLDNQDRSSSIFVNETVDEYQLEHGFAALISVQGSFGDIKVHYGLHTEVAGQHGPVSFVSPSNAMCWVKVTFNVTTQTMP